jgi:hypothetical protein
MKGAERLMCCARPRTTTIGLGHSDFYGAEQFRYELYDKWNPPICVLGDPGPHFPQDEEAAKADVQKAIDACNIYWFSAAMHQLQDYYCHKGYEWAPCRCKFGHAWDSVFGSDPDKDPERWSEAQRATLPLADEYRSKCPYDCVQDKGKPPLPRF